MMKELKKIGCKFQEMILSEIQKKCEQKVKEILEQIDPETNEEVFNNISDEFQSLKDVTELIFENPYRATLIYDNVRRILLAIAQERGYFDKMKYGGKVADNILNNYYWFKLYCSIVHNKQCNYRYDYILNSMKKSRDTFLEHGLIPVSEKRNVAIIGHLVLIWYFMEDIFNEYAEILLLSDEEIKKGTEKLEGSESANGKTTNLYGFINSLKHDVGFITSYLRGEEKGTFFRLQDINFFASVGDVVFFGDNQQKNRTGKDFPSFTAHYVRKP